MGEETGKALWTRGNADCKQYMFCQRRTDAPLTQEEEQRKWETRIR
jgi:hypothetical protein